MTKPKSCWHSTVRFIFSGCVEEGGAVTLAFSYEPLAGEIGFFHLAGGSSFNYCKSSPIVEPSK